MTSLEQLLHTLDDDGLFDAGQAHAGQAHAGQAHDRLASGALARARTRSRRRLAAVVAAGAAATVVALGAGVLVGDLAARTTTPPRPGATTSGTDPWAARPRVNVLLVGSDAGPARTGVRPDTIMVASIDTATGDTVLVGVPRNLQHVPFPPGTRQAAAYPDGFWCPDATGTNTECLLNALWTFGEQRRAEYYPGDPHPGLTATLQGAEQVTGLHMDEYAVLDLRGLVQVVDALGGVTVDVPERLPIGGSAQNPTPQAWLAAGRQRLDGYHALWYARSRWSTSDYNRMTRQRCLVESLIRQADPLTVATSFGKIMGALRDNLQTSITVGDLDAWVTLLQRVQHARLRSLALTPGGAAHVDPARPDFGAIHRAVQAALAPPAGSSATTSAAVTTGSAAPSLCGA